MPRFLFGFSLGTFSKDFICLRPPSCYILRPTITSTKQYKKLLPSKAFGTIKWNNKNPFKPNNNKWHRNYRILDFACHKATPKPPPQRKTDSTRAKKPQTFYSDAMGGRIWRRNSDILIISGDIFVRQFYYFRPVISSNKQRSFVLSVNRQVLTFFFSVVSPSPKKTRRKMWKPF